MNPIGVFLAGVGLGLLSGLICLILPMCISREDDDWHWQTGRPGKFWERRSYEL